MQRMKVQKAAEDAYITEAKTKVAMAEANVAKSKFLKSKEKLENCGF